MSIGYLAGSFDLINVRDLDLIAQANQFCSRLVIGVFSDDFAERHYGRPPVVPAKERLALVAHMRGVDEVVLYDGSVPTLGPATTYFSVYGEDTLPDMGETWVLQPTRETASRTLREALAQLRRKDVA